MTQPSDHLDSHLERLMETAYEALAATPDRQRAPVQPERIGPWPVTGLLGRGGTSCVWRGRDPELGREIAIKVIDARHAGSLAQRFLDEARICSQLAHPGIVPVYAWGRLEDGRPYFTMRLVEGQTLAAQLDARTDPAQGLQPFLEVFARVCETVAFAHARGVVHGDLKPHNVMVGTYGQVQVMDWGFSRLLEGSADAEARVMGTPAFMAPEQAQHAGKVDERTDVFGLGAILCVILTGAPPFQGKSRSEVQVRAAQGLLGEASQRLRQCGADAGLVALALQCLQADPAARPRDAAGVAAAVQAWFHSVEERAHRLELAAAEAQARAREQRRARRAFMALLLLAALCAAIYAWMQFERQASDYEKRMVVAQAVERARNLRSGADLAGPARLQRLGEAALAAQQARTFAATIADAALQQEVEQLSRQLDADRDAASRDAVMEQWLDDFPSHLDRTREQLEADFTAAFASFGVDVEGLPAEEAVAQLRRSSIAKALARALDDWGFVRRTQPGMQPEAWRRFHELALRVDEDPLRSAVRRAQLQSDRDELRRLAALPEYASAPSDTLDLLASGLAQTRERDSAIAVWQRANARHPDSVRVIHSLAVSHLGDPVCPPWDEIVRLFSTGTAVQPHSAHLWTDLAYALQAQGNPALAEAALQRALELEPRDERALASLVDLLRCQGRPAEALEQGRKAARTAGAAGLWRVLGSALLTAGFGAEAAEALRRAAALDGSAVHHEALGQALLELGDVGAAACFHRALELEPKRTAARVYLGLALRQQGRFAEAVTNLRAGRGSSGTTWAALCDGWLDETTRVASAAEALPEPGDDAPVDATVERALAALLGGRPLLAARCYREAFARDPAAARGAFVGWNRDRAAEAAARASVTDGAWRAQAVAWLSESIAALRHRFDAGELAPAEVQRRLALWRHDAHLGLLLPDLQSELAGLEQALAKGEPEARLQAPFRDSYEYRSLGSIPGVLQPYGGLMFERSDPHTMVVGGHAQRDTAALHAVALTRDVRGHIDGFRKSRQLAAAPFVDGGIARGPQGALFYTRNPSAEIGLLLAGAPGPHRVVKLAGASAGGLAFVPAGMPGSGRTKILSWPGGQWSDAEVAITADGFELRNQRHVATLPGGPDGFAFLPPGEAPFDRATVLVAEWSVHSLAAYDLDGNGDPIVATRRLVLSGCRGVLGVAVDPTNGDVLLSTWRRDGTEVIGLLQRTGR